MVLFLLRSYVRLQEIFANTQIYISYHDISRPQVSATVRCHATHSMASRGSPSSPNRSPSSNTEWNLTPLQAKIQGWKLKIKNDSKKNRQTFNICFLNMCLITCCVCIFPFSVFLILSTCGFPTVLPRFQLQSLNPKFANTNDWTTVCLVLLI